MPKSTVEVFLDGPFEENDEGLPRFVAHVFVDGWPTAVDEVHAIDGQAAMAAAVKAHR